jgi:hypothetical protein
VQATNRLFSSWRSICYRTNFPPFAAGSPKEKAPGSPRAFSAIRAVRYWRLSGRCETQAYRRSYRNSSRRPWYS